MYQVLIGFVAAAASCVGTPTVPAFEPWPPITPILLERSDHLHKPPDFPQASLLHIRDRQMANHRGTFPDPVQDHKKELPSERRLGHDTFFGPHSRYIMYQVLIGFVAAAASCVGTPTVPAFEPWPPITPILLERSDHLHKPPDFPQASLLHIRDRQMANHHGTFPDPVQDHKKELPSERPLGHDTFFGPHSRYIMYQTRSGKTCVLPGVLSILLVNCRSIKNKVDEFASLVATVEPQIIMGTESWLDDSVRSAEIFPSGYTVYRKDRHRHAGGVLLLISSRLNSQPLFFDDDTESVWCRVFFPKGKTLVIGTFYRPPNSSEEPIGKLADALSVIPDGSILGGDFNLPDFDWIAGNSTNNTSQLYRQFKELVSTFGFNQYVLEPTRQNAILDLMLCNDTNIISKVSVIPGISDHKAVVAELSLLSASNQMQHPRQVFMFHKGNYEAISAELESYLEIFIRLSESLECGKQRWVAKTSISKRTSRVTKPYSLKHYGL
ncbi:uncharacterized protein LOC144160656 [Haemaphysalis longicornis]